MNKFIILKINKVIGFDGILLWLFVVVGIFIVVLLINLYLCSLREVKVYDDWKVVRLNFIFKKDDELDRGNYCLLFMLSVLSKIFEFCVIDFIVDYVFICN